MPVLRINDVPLGDGRRRVEVSWQDGAARQVAVSSVAYQVGGQDAEKVRWYLEDYAEFPADPAPVIAREAEARLAEAGTDLFRRVFSDADAAGIWERARDRLSGVRVEVDADPGAGPGLAWELLRDPGRDAAVALCGCRESRPPHATRRYSLTMPPMRGCLRTRCCSRSTGSGSGFSGAAESSDR